MLGKTEEDPFLGISLTVQWKRPVTHRTAIIWVGAQRTMLQKVGWRRWRKAHGENDILL
jgi:hypothetical protein